MHGANYDFDSKLLGTGIESLSGFIQISSDEKIILFTVKGQIYP